MCKGKTKETERHQETGNWGRQSWWVRDGEQPLRESWGERDRLSDSQGWGSRKLRRDGDPEGRAREGKPGERELQRVATNSEPQTQRG